ncbi:hypothetical protein Tsubulata_029309, partial [Turnera subulata]
GVRSRYGEVLSSSLFKKKNPHSQLISTTLTSPLSLLSLLTGDATSPYSPSHRRGSPSLTVTVTGDYLSHSPQSSPSHRRRDVATSPCIPSPSREDPTSRHHSRGRHGSRPTSPPPPR